MKTKPVSVINLLAQDSPQLLMLLKDLSHHSATLKYLQISDFRMRVEDAQALTTTLTRLPLLEELQLKDNRLKTPHMAALLESFRGLSNLINLKITGSTINLEFMRLLSQALPELNQLRDLNLSSNQISHRGAFSLAASLPQCPALQYLNLNENHIGNRGTSYIALALPDSSIKRLDLSMNGIGDEGIIHLLATCVKLKELDLSENRFGDIGANALAEFLRSPLPKALQDLDISLSDEFRLTQRLPSEQQISANGFFQIALSLFNINSRNVSFTNLSNSDNEDAPPLPPEVTRLLALATLLRNCRITDAPEVAQFQGLRELNFNNLPLPPVTEEDRLAVIETHNGEKDGLIHANRQAAAARQAEERAHLAAQTRQVENAGIKRHAQNGGETEDGSRPKRKPEATTTETPTSTEPAPTTTSAQASTLRERPDHQPNL